MKSMHFESEFGSFLKELLLGHGDCDGIFSNKIQTKTVARGPEKFRMILS
jgi:hypothetical protein